MSCVGGEKVGMTRSYREPDPCLSGRGERRPGSGVSLECVPPLALTSSIDSKILAGGSIFLTVGFLGMGPPQTMWATQ